VFNFYSTDGVSGRLVMVSQIPHLILCTGFHGLGLLARFVAKNFHLRFYLSLRSVNVLTQFLLHIFPIISFRESVASGSNTDIDCPVIDVSSF
jgi:hypothetical protein